MKLTVHIETIPHADQRYSTAGDWFIKDGVLEIRASEMDDQQHSVLIILHELVEALVTSAGDVDALPKLAEITDEFDTRHKDYGEPGFRPDCPYYEGHAIATVVEHLAAMSWGTNWNDYEEEVDDLTTNVSIE